MGKDTGNQADCSIDDRRDLNGQSRIIAPLIASDFDDLSCSSAKIECYCSSESKLRDGWDAIPTNSDIQWIDSVDIT